MMLMQTGIKELTCIVMLEAWLVKLGLFSQNLLGFNGIPPNKENQRWPLECVGDWLRLASYQEENKHKCIPIYLIELKKASSIQLTVASIDRSKENVGVSQPETELSLGAATNWADNLIINPSSQPMSSSLQITCGNCFYLSSPHQSTPNSPTSRTMSSKASSTTSQPTPNSPMSCRPRTRS